MWNISRKLKESDAPNPIRKCILNSLSFQQIDFLAYHSVAVVAVAVVVMVTVIVITETV